ncbi:MAG: GlyGly-CTERM sorting domain-containing protein [Acinetobacter baumannii]|nr:GlyGly-CTERM sorting domain-containing protein [Acinetobacter baumannii]QFH46418.1 GlyGly-CTERM sorting domain-containing protein [Acinetobacter baumannii]RSP36089.1 GlyGly-CTERM sorting domain-containing protein [Acinetobacter baumannii]HAV5484739.1 GlyGly-CTERM sorting domain-containing protein [Acinetobacter baumannii]
MLSCAHLSYSQPLASCKGLLPLLNTAIHSRGGGGGGSIGILSIVSLLSLIAYRRYRK